MTRKTRDREGSVQVKRARRTSGVFCYGCGSGQLTRPAAIRQCKTLPRVDFQGGNRKQKTQAQNERRRKWRCGYERRRKR